MNLKVQGRICVLLMLVLGLVACGKTQLTDAEYIERAKEHMDANELRAAVIEFKNALSVNADNMEARWLLGQVYVVMGMGAAAEKELVRARELGVSEIAIMPSLADALLLQEQYDKVLEQIVPDRNASPAVRAKIFYIRGEAELGLENLEAGCAFFTQARAEDAKFAAAYLGLAKCAAAQENLEDTRQQIHTALEVDPGHVESWLFLGRLERMQGQLVAAEEAFGKAIEAAPYSIIALYEHANTILAMDNLGAYREDLAKIRKLSPRNNLSYYLQAQLDIKEGRVEAARDNLNQVISQNPEHIQSQLLLGAVNLELGTYATAEASLGRIVTRIPNSELARRLLATAQLKGGYADRAVETLQPLLSVEKPAAADLTLAGEAYLRTGDISRAKVAFTLAQEERPDSSQAQVNLARASLVGGETEQALQNLGVAVAIDPTKTSADKLLILTHLTAKQYDAAIETAQRLADKAPDEVLAPHLEGAAYLGKQELAAARLAFEQALAIEPTFTLSLLKLADIDVLENKPEAAKERLKAAVKNNDKDSRLMLALARLVQQAGDQAQALQWLEKAVAADPRAIEPRESLVHFLVAEKQEDRALSVATEAVQLNPGSPTALNLLGMTQMATNDRKGALSTYKRLTADLPQEPGSHYRLGLTLMGLGRHDEARKSLTTALELTPNSLEVQGTLGVLENQVKHWADAVKIARDIQRSHPEHHTGYMLEGDALLGQDKAAEAVNLYEKAFEKAKNGTTLIRLTQALTDAGRGTEAEGRLLDWLKTQPNNSEVRLHLAGHYIRHGKLNNAISQYEDLAARFPEDGLVMNNLADLYQRSGDVRALKTAERAFELEPGQPVVLDTLGWILTQQGQAKRGLELLDKARTKAPKNRLVRFHYASALVIAGEKDKAKQELQALLASGPFPQEDEARALLDQL